MFKKVARALIWMTVGIEFIGAMVLDTMLESKSRRERDDYINNN